LVKRHGRIDITEVSIYVFVNFFLKASKQWQYFIYASQSRPRPNH
jgi:hypothetical protein